MAPLGEAKAETFPGWSLWGALKVVMQTHRKNYYHIYKTKMEHTIALPEGLMEWKTETS